MIQWKLQHVSFHCFSHRFSPNFWPIADTCRRYTLINTRLFICTLLLSVTSIPILNTFVARIQCNMISSTCFFLLLPLLLQLLFATLLEWQVRFGIRMKNANKWRKKCAFIFITNQFLLFIAITHTSSFSLCTLLLIVFFLYARVPVLFAHTI